jgi:peroxiredoxin
MDDAAGLPVGAEAPDFTAPLVSHDGTTEEVRLSDLLVDQAVLLVFYTVDFSPDCIDEWCSFRDFDWFSETDSVRVVGISKSGTYLHEKFIDFLDVDFPLFSDEDLDVAEQYGVKHRSFKLFPRARRSCFLVDQDGTNRYRWLAEHWLDPTRDVPPIEDVHDAIVREIDE